MRTLERFSEQGENTLRIKHAAERTTIVQNRLHAVTESSSRLSLSRINDNLISPDVPAVVVTTYRTPK